MAAENAEASSNGLDDTLKNFICEKWQIEHLKPFQNQALWNVCVNQKDSIISMPTGQGKSICFEAISSVYDSINKSHLKVLVLSPLRLLMKMQVDHMNKLGIPSVNLGCYEEEELYKSRYIFGCPEDYLSVRNVIQKIKTEDIGCLVFDEVHTSVEWGLSNQKKENAFRPYFAEIRTLRGFFPNATMLGVTATITKKTLTRIKELLCMRNPFVWQGSPDRPNIRMTSFRVPRGLESMDWLANKLILDKENCPRTIVYCRRVQDVSDLFFHFKERVGKDSKLFDMIHSSTLEEVKDEIIDHIIQADSNLRIVFATKVLGMGLNLLFNVVVHYGPPNSVEEYVQQIGRVGRNGKPAQSITLFSPMQLQHVDASMKRILKDGESNCIRRLILNFFGYEITPYNPLHLCCNICTRNCSCSCCKEHYSIYEHALSKTVDCNAASEEILELATSNLLDLQNKLNSEFGNTEQSLNGSVIFKLLENIDNISDIQDIIILTNVSNEIAERILGIFKQISE